MSGIGQQLAAAYPEAYKELTGVRVETFTERYVGGAAGSSSGSSRGCSPLRASSRWL